MTAKTTILQTLYVHVVLILRFFHKFYILFHMLDTFYLSRLFPSITLGLVYTSDRSGVVSGVGIGRKFWSSVNRHDGSGIVSLAFKAKLDFVCKHSRWRTREMTLLLLLFILIRSLQWNQTQHHGNKYLNGETREHCSHTTAWSWLTKTSNKWNWIHYCYRSEVLLV